MRNLLLFRFTIANALAICLTAALWLNGYVWPVIEGGAPITWGILGLFGIGFLWCAKEIVVISMDLNLDKEIGAHPTVEAVADKDGAKVEWLSNVAEWLARLGLIGTVVGIMQALIGIDSSSITDPSGALIAVGNLASGVGMALTTTLLGAALAIWHEINVRMLRTAMKVYWSDRLAAAHGIGKIRVVD